MKTTKYVDLHNSGSLIISWTIWLPHSNFNYKLSFFKSKLEINIKFDLNHFLKSNYEEKLIYPNSNVIKSDEMEK